MTADSNGPVLAPLTTRMHGTFDSIPHEPYGLHYLGLHVNGWCYYIMDDFGNAVPTAGVFQCL